MPSPRTVDGNGSSTTEPSPGSWKTHLIAEQRSLCVASLRVLGYQLSRTNSQAGVCSSHLAQGTPPGQLFRQRANSDLPVAPFPIGDGVRQEGSTSCVRYFWREIAGHPFGTKCHACRHPWRSAQPPTRAVCRCPCGRWHNPRGAWKSHPKRWLSILGRARPATSPAWQSPPGRAGLAEPRLAGPRLAGPRIAGSWEPSPRKPPAPPLPIRI